MMTHTLNHLLAGLHHLPEFHKLSVWLGKGHGSLEYGRNLPLLQWLNIREDPLLRDITPLANHPALEQFSFKVTRIRT